MDRLRDGDALDFERFLLESGMDEGPDPELRQRVLAAVGAAAAAGAAGAIVHSASYAAHTAAGGGTAVAGGGAVTAGAAGGAGTVVSATAGMAQVSAGVAMKALLVKGILVVATAGAATGVVAVVHHEAAPATPIATETLAEGAAEAPRPARAAAATSEPAVLPAEKPPAVDPRATIAGKRALPPPAASAAHPAAAAADAGTAGVATPAPAVTVVSPEPPRASSISLEVAALDRARTALSRGDAPAALSELVRYDSEFPAGVLRHEKTVLEVRALLAADQRQKARVRVEEFLARHPGSAQAARLRALVE